MMKNISIGLALLLLISSSSAFAQPDTSQLVPPEPTGLSAGLKAPFEICFRLIYSVGFIPLYIVRGFGDVWAGWGCPPISLILASMSFLAPAVFKDSIIIFLFLALIEMVVLPVIIPLLGAVCILPAWGITGVGTLLFAIADFISKINAMTAETSGSRGNAGWLNV